MALETTAGVFHATYQGKVKKNLPAGAPPCSDSGLIPAGFLHPYPSLEVWVGLAVRAVTREGTTISIWSTKVEKLLGHSSLYIACNTEVEELNLLFPDTTPEEVNIDVDFSARGGKLS